MYYYFFPFDGDNIENCGIFLSTAQAFGYYGKLFNTNVGNYMLINRAYRSIIYINRNRAWYVFKCSSLFSLVHRCNKIKYIILLAKCIFKNNNINSFE